MTRRIEVVTVVRQTVVGGSVVAAVTSVNKCLVVLRADGSRHAKVDGRMWKVVNGVVLVTT